MDAMREYSTELRENKPIRYGDLVFHPLLVKHFALYQNARQAMEIMQASLPVRFARLSWIKCLWEMDMEAQKEFGQAPGYFQSVMFILDAALHTNAVSNPTALQIAQDSGGAFAALVIQQDRGSPVVLDECKMNDVRKILAAQNGYEIPNECWNPDLVRAQQYLRQQRESTTQGADLSEAVYALASVSGTRAGEIWNWPIAEFLGMQSAADRRLRFLICAMAELSGNVKFKGGNPYPTWISRKKGELPTGFQDLKTLEDGAKGLLSKPTTDKE